MPGLWGGYSRDTREIYLSADCPAELLSAVLIEEIGHFLDQELCSEETPGEEGALFAAVVLGLPLCDASSDDSLALISLQDRQLLVEAARKSRGSSKARSSSKSGRKKRGSSNGGGSNSVGGGGSGYAEVGGSSSNPKLQENILYATQDGARIQQKAAGDRLVGSRGNDTFAVISQDVKIEDPNGGTDIVESPVDFSIANFSVIENLALTGADNTSATGNLKANVISGNSGNNKLDGGLDSSIDTLQGGAGNDTYVLRDNVDKVVEAVGGGTDTIETTQSTFSMANYANVENLAYSGTGTGVAFTGNSGNNMLTGTAGADSLDGGTGADTLSGGLGNDTYFVDSSGDLVIENANAGKDFVVSTAAAYVLGDNIESLALDGSGDIAGTGNDSKNTLTGNNANNTLSGRGGDDYIVGDGQLPSISLTGRTVTDVAAGYLLNGTNALVNNLGTPSSVTNAGSFGERTVTRGDDNSSSVIDITPIFGPNGLNLYGNQVKSIFINTNGNITFEGALSTFNPRSIDAGLGNSIIAPFWADVYTSSGRSNVSPGGNSAGTNLIYWDVDDENRVLTVTWDDVRYFGQQTSGTNADTKVNAFQVQLIDSGGGNAFIVFRYENIDWTTGTASGGTNGLGGQAARAGFNTGTGTVIELPQSGDDLSMLDLDQNFPQAGLNSGQPGVYVFEIRNGAFVENFGGNDSLLGGTGNDTLLGNGGNDTLFGEEGDDRLDGGVGADSMLGGLGDDIYVVDNASDTVVELAGEGTDVIEAASSYTLTSGSSLEVLRLNGLSNTSGSGNALANSLFGNAGNNVLNGDGGNDTLDGGAGDDTLLGGDGEDVFIYDSADNSIDGGAGTDEVQSPVSITLAGGRFTSVENIRLTGSSNLNAAGDFLANIIYGNAGNNSLDGAGGKDTLIAGDGNDTLNGGKADGVSDSLVGGKGDDLYILDSALDSIFDEEGNDTVLATSSVNLGSSLGAGIENIILSNDLSVADANINATGNASANSITGNAGNNQLDGGGGADTLIGGAGFDILNGGTADGQVDFLQGGEGNDRYIVTDSTPDVIRDSGGTDTVETSVSFNIGDTLRVEGIEHLLYKGSNSAATLTGSAGDNSIKSEGAGADTLIGGAGNDTLDGGAGANSLTGGDGDDYYIVNSSSEKIYEDNSSGSGLDTVLTKIETFALGLTSNVEILTYDPLGTAKTTLSGSDSDNTIIGGNFGNSLSGFGGNDYLLGGVQADTLLGGEGNDTLDGKSGVNSLIGGSGDDYYITDSQTVNILEEVDTLVGGDKDTVRSSVAFDLSYSSKLAGIEGLYLTGSASLAGTGNSGDNTITGNDGNNDLDGKAGNDTILGGLGADYIKGDEGNDSIVGGGDIQGDVPADASTPILLASGQTYTGQINSRNETDWIKVELKVGVTYTFTIDSQLEGAEVLKDRSDVAFGAQGSDQYWGANGYWQYDGINWNWINDDPNFTREPLIGDLSGSSQNQNGSPWEGKLRDHNQLVIKPDGSSAYGYFDPELVKSNRFSKNNIVGFQFTPFESGTFFIPVSGAGPALGSYRVTLTDPDNLANGAPALADNASNTLVGGLGADTLVAGNGRDAQGNAIGDILLGGTNGLVGSVDTDTLGDTLIGGDGNDSLDGGNGANSLIGGKGNDYYYIRSAGDQIVEKIDGGTADAMIVNFSAKLGGQWDIVLDPDHTPTGPAFQFANIENVTLTGSANTSVLGSPNSDNIVGNFGDNTFDGGTGDDTLLGMGGNDSLLGGEGADSIDGGSGISTLDGGAGSDTYVVNDRDDRIINEQAGLDGGQDVVFTAFNFDPILSDPVSGFAPDVADNSPSITKSQSFASNDLSSFYALEHFVLTGAAAYGVGNALANSMTAASSSALLLGMGGEDTLLGGAGNDSLFGDTPDFYASPDIYAAAPKDTRTKEFVDGVVGQAASDYLEGGAGDDYLDGGRGYDTMLGGAGNDTFVQDNVEDYIVAGGGANELISSVNINKAADGISKLTLIVAKQAEGSGQDQVASFGSFLGTSSANNTSQSLEFGGLDFTVNSANFLQVMYAPREGQVFKSVNGNTPEGALDLVLGEMEADANNPGKFEVDLSWSAGDIQAVGYTVRYKLSGDDDTWHTYVNGRSQDFQGTASNPTLKITNLEEGAYDFEVVAFERTLSAHNGAAQYVTLQGGSGSDVLSGRRLTSVLNGGLTDDQWTDPLVLNNPIDPLPVGFIFNSGPYDSIPTLPGDFATYIDGGFGNDLLYGARVNDESGDAYTLQGIEFEGLNTLVGGQGSDTFAVLNGGRAIGDEFDWVVKYGNETPVTTETGEGASLNGGQHNLVVSRVPYLVLSDTHVHQGKFIDQLALADWGQFGMGNRLDNYIYDGFWTPYASNTLVGNTGRDSIIANSSLDFLIGGTAYGTDNVGLAIADFVGVEIGGNGLKNSIFRDTDPVPVSLSGPAVADPSQFWFVPGYYGGVYDPNRNQDTLAASEEVKYDDGLTLDGGAGRDSLVGTETEIDKTGDMFIVSQGFGGNGSQNILVGDAVIGNGGNDTVTFTDSDYLWWSGHQEGAVLQKNTYALGDDISNLILGEGAASARNATGNRTSTGYKDAVGSNLIIGNEFANILDGYGVGGEDQTGSGIDTLTGGSGDDLFVVSGYTKSTASKWDVSAEEIDKKDDPNNGKYKLDLTESTFTDADYVLISDFEASDSIRLDGLLSQYWIGAAPSKSGLGEDNVRPGAAGLTEFGIYKAPTGLKDGPNLVAHIRLKGWSLAPADLSPSNYAFTPNFGPISAQKEYLGWGAFYKLDGSSFASNVDQWQYVQKDSYASINQIFLAGDNTFQGGSTNDSFNGYDGNDTLKGGAGNDTLIGGEGQDSLLGEAGADSLLGEAGFDTLLGGDGNDTLDGGAGSDSLLGEAGNDSLFGGAGADFLDGGAGVNSLFGGDGNDTLVWSALNATMDGGAGINNLLFNSGATFDDTSFGVISNISKIALSDEDDLVSLGTNAVTKGFTSINSNGGNDTLDASAINAAVTLSGGAGEDRILGGFANDSLVGGADNDTLLGGGDGDTLLGEAGADSLLGGADNDSLLGGADNDTLLGEDGNDTLLGEAGADSLLGGTGADSLFGGADNDTLLGEDGNDTLLGEAGDDSLRGGADNDSLFGGANNDTLLGEDGNDTLLGEAGDDSLLGGMGDDSLVAGTGTDTLLGEDGNDTLVAEAIGAASLLGGVDNDSFLFADGTQLANNTVVGGSGTDTLVLTAAATVTDAQLANVREVEVIQASSLAGNSITVGTNALAQAGGVLSLFGGCSSDILSAAGMTSGNIWIQSDSVGGSSTQGDTLVAGTGTSRATLVGNTSASATNYFQISAAALLGNNSIVGGASSTDYLQITTNGQVLSDASFAQVSGLDGLILTGGANTITLGATAEGKFGTTVSLTGGVTGGDTINLSATTKKVYVDASAGTTGDTITAGTNDNTLIGGSAASANDLFIFTSESNLNGASVIGGGGTDTLRLSANGQTVLTTALDKLSSIEVFDLVGAGNSITFGNISAGIATIVGGTGPNTFNASDYDSNPNVLTWDMNASNGSDSLVGGKNGNLFQIKNGANLQNSQIAGDALKDDTIQLLAGAQTLGDSAFTNISSIEKFILGSATNGNSIALGTTAASQDIATVIGGTSKDTIDASGFGKEIWIDASAGTGARLIGSTTAPAGNTLIGGSAGGNEFVVGALGANSIVGGSNGQDTLSFSTATTINPGNLNSLSKIGTLKFNAAGNDIELGADGLIAGIRTLVGGEGSDNGAGNTFNTSAYGTAGVLFQITDQNYLANITTMVGGTGVDTLKFSRDGVSVTDENVAKLLNIDVLRTANGNNRFLISNQFETAGIESIIGGTGNDTIDTSDSNIYNPSDIITFDVSAGSAYTLVSNTSNFLYAKVIGSTAGGSVIIDGTSLADSAFANMFQANIKTLQMRNTSNNTVTLGENAKASGLDVLTMSEGNDTIDVRAFLGALAVSGGAGNDLLKTSFAALSDLTFTGGADNDTLQIEGSDARAITSLKGAFEALKLNGGNNFVVLGNDAGLSTIYGGGGADTISMFNNSTGINFVMDATILTAMPDAASLNGGSGSDTLSVTNVDAGIPGFIDAQFMRVGSSGWANGLGAIENFVTDSGGGNTYDFGSSAYAAGIQTIYAHAGDQLDAGGFNDSDPLTPPADDRALNFVFSTVADFTTSTINGTTRTDTLTFTEDTQTIDDTDIDSTGSFGVLVLANGSNDVTLDDNAQDNELKTVIGGSGSDRFNTSGYTNLLNASLVGGAGNDSILAGAGADNLIGTNSTARGANEKDTLTGGGGNDLFVLGDATNAYYNTGVRANDYAVITDFSGGDKIQLTDLSVLYKPTAPLTNNYGYLAGATDIYGVGALGVGVNSYIYADTDKSGSITTGDNLIAAVNSTAGALTNADLLLTTKFSIV
jgi:Ca2+-binding RTX toxin-like protein